MAVRLIIDGYNLLGAQGQVGTSLPQERDTVRNALLRDLAGYRRRKGHMVTVVFDAWREQGGLEHYEQHDGVEVIFTRAGERADQVIQRLAQKWGRECAVVSSDREVMAGAQQSRAFVMTSQEFLAKLHAKVDSPVSTAGVPDPRAMDDEKCEEEIPPRRPEKKGNPRKLSKKLRDRQRKLKGF